MKLITRYIIALANLYGVVHKNKVVEIYNLQNDDKVSEITIRKNTISIDDTKINIDDLNSEGVDLFKDYFAHEALVENDYVESLLTLKRDKPYYIPTKNELLKYVDDLYFEKTIQFNKLLEYMKKYVFKKNTLQAPAVCHAIQNRAQCNASFSEIFTIFEDWDIALKDEQQAKELVELITQLMNNTRIRENNGHTPREISELSGKNHSESLQSKDYNISELSYKGDNTFINANKVGRNDPCPCGSGKKYKKCCLNKENELH